MFISEKASRVRWLEALAARRNRLEIVKARSQGQISRRDLVRWGLLTAGGSMVLKNGLSPWATSAWAQVPTGTARSPLFGAKKFEQRLPRAVVPKPIPIVQSSNGEAVFQTAVSGAELPARRLSYHDEFSTSGGTARLNPVTEQGPLEGRPPGEFFAHQRWNEFFPKVGYLLSMGQAKGNLQFHPRFPAQERNKVWTFGVREPGTAGSAEGLQTGSAAPLLIKARYGEPMLTRIYNDLPVHREENGGFGRNEMSTHLHNMHNGAESDGASNAHHFPGTFYDYLWSVALARRDMPSRWVTNDPKHLDKASGPDDGDGLRRVAGDFREIQSSLWFHDHRFFFTAENVYKGSAAVLNVYSGPDRGREDLNDGINLRLPSGSLKKWGNLDFDVNLSFTNVAWDKDGQLFYDVFDVDGFLGDVMLVNGTYAPYMELLPRRYRFRTLNAMVARFIRMVLVVTQGRFAKGTKVPVYMVANDGNLMVKPIRLTDFDEQSPAERYDFVVDFSMFRPGERLQLLNVLEQVDGRKPKRTVTVGEALAGIEDDPCVGPFMEFRVVDKLMSVDDPTYEYDVAKATPLAPLDRSVNFATAAWSPSGASTLTTQIPVVAPVRERHLTFGRSGGDDARVTADGQCIPDCGEFEKFPWTIKVNGQGAHNLNANRISLLIPKPGETEHWTLENSGSGWDHPIHLHFEEGITLNRGTNSLPNTERLVRKDVWRLRELGKVKIQLTFGEFGGAYVTHCHNVNHEDFAMLLRFQLLSDRPGSAHGVISKTPVPTDKGVMWLDPEILPEGDPRKRV